MTIESNGHSGPNAHLIEGWTDLWNGDIARARRICTDDVTIRFGGQESGLRGDSISGSVALGRYIADFRESRSGLTYVLVEVQSTAQWGYCLWDAVAGERHVGGIDTFWFASGRIARVTSVTGERSMRR